MSNFINDCINADALLEEIDDYVKEWHDSDTEMTIHEFLGMTQEEYFLWVENDCILKYIIKAHTESKNINDILKEVSEEGFKMVARAENAEEAKAIYKWLLETGRIDKINE